jgi:alpha-1,3-glucan synthase
MMGNRAWQRHGCYRLGSEQYFHFPLDKALIGCKDEWNSLDHFDPTTDSRRLFKHMLFLRQQYSVLLDGFGLDNLRNITYEIERPGSNGVATEMGIWVLQRRPIEGQRLGGNNTNALLIFMNENSTTTYKPACTDKQKYIPTGNFRAGTTLRNLFAPYETYTVTAGANNDGCIAQVELNAFGFKALVPAANWVAPLPAITYFSPGHDARIFAESGDANATSVAVEIQFNQEMNCDDVTRKISVNVYSSGHGSAPTISRNAVTCGTMTNATASKVQGGDTSAWRWATTLNNVPDGILELIIDNPSNEAGTATTGSKDHLLVRKGSPKNAMVNSAVTHDTGVFAEKDGKYVFTHHAFGAEKFRYSWNFGRNWTKWTDWEDETTIEKNQFKGKDYFWDGQHIMVQCKLCLAHFIFRDLD